MSTDARDETLAILRQTSAGAWAVREIERLAAALALQVEQEAANWRRGEDERNRLRTALAACQTYDYRTLADEVERLNADLASSREQLADLTKRWGAVVDDRERLRTTVTSLCDRLDHIDNIAHDGVIQHDEKVRQIAEWSGGFARLPAETPAAAAEPPYYVRTFWSPDKKYLVTVHVTVPAGGDCNIIGFQDDDGAEWEPASEQQDVTKFRIETPAPQSGEPNV